jgi:hypothetical protein
MERWLTSEPEMRDQGGLSGAVLLSRLRIVDWRILTVGALLDAHSYRAGLVTCQRRWHFEVEYFEIGSSPSLTS